MATVTITTAPTLVLPAGNRSVSVLQNLSDTDIFVGDSPNVTVADGPHSGIRVRAGGGTLTLTGLPGNPGLPGSPLYAVHAGSGGKPLRHLTR